MGIVAYIETALEAARFKNLEDGTFYGSIPGFNGVWANSRTLRECRKELREVLEDWIVLKIRSGDKLPAIHGRRLKIPVAVHA